MGGVCGDTRIRSRRQKREQLLQGEVPVSAQKSLLLLSLWGPFSPSRSHLSLLIIHAFSPKPVLSWSQSALCNSERERFSKGCFYWHAVFLSSEREMGPIQKVKAQTVNICLS